MFCLVYRMSHVTFRQWIVLLKYFQWNMFLTLTTNTCPTIGFQRAFATGVACRQGTLTPPDTWSRPFGTCICSTCWDQSFSDIGFQRAFTTGVACRQGTLTPPDTWSRPFGTYIYSTCWDQSFSELVVILPDYALRISLGTFSILLYNKEAVSSVRYNVTFRQWIVLLRYFQWNMFLTLTTNTCPFSVYNISWKSKKLVYFSF